MSPFVRGRFIPETESTGRAKTWLDVLLWLPQVSRDEVAVLNSIEILRVYLSGVTPTQCSINLWVPDTFSETMRGLTAIRIEFGTVQKANPTAKVEAALGPNAPAELIEIGATALARDADVVVTSNPDWYPYAPAFEKL